MLPTKPPAISRKIQGKGPNVPVVAVKTINFHEPVDGFILSFIGGQETVLKASPDCLTAMSVF